MRRNSLSWGFLALCCCVGALAQELEVEPAPPSIGSDVPLTYFGPAPSTVDPRLVGPVQLLKSGTVDAAAGTVTLPLYFGYTARPGVSQRIPYFYVLTDTTDLALSQALGVNHAAKLKFAIQPGVYRTGRLDSRNFLVTSTGWVDFSPVRSVTPGPAPNLFPPTAFTPGSVGRDGYSPIVVIGNDAYNMPIIADGTNLDRLRPLCNLERLSPAQRTFARTFVHDKVVNLCLNLAGTGGTVTLELTPGFTFAKPLLYLSTDAYPALPAAVESVTNVPVFANITVGGDDSLFSAVERLFIITNGYTNADINPTRRTDGPRNEKSHPLRQGMNSALRGDGSPLNVLGGIPTVATDYSPLWDLNIGSWTPYAVANGYRERLTEEFQYLGHVQRGYITGPGNTTFRSSGAIVNCPPVMRFL